MKKDMRWPVNMFVFLHFHCHQLFWIIQFTCYIWVAKSHRLDKSLCWNHWESILQSSFEVLASEQLEICTTCVLQLQRRRDLCFVLVLSSLAGRSGWHGGWYPETPMVPWIYGSYSFKIINTWLIMWGLLSPIEAN